MTGSDCRPGICYVSVRNAAALWRRLLILREGMNERSPRWGFHPVYLWIAVPFIALLWVPFFNRMTPELFGIPFFYWYQTVGTILGSLCIVPVYLFKKRQRANKQNSGE
jgi:putative solute:sodium symporter small subunit